MGAVAVYLDLGVQREGNRVVVGAKLLDFQRGAGLLFAELVAGEAKHGETFLAELVVDGLQLLVLPSEAALAGHVDDQHDLAFVRLEGGFFTVDVLQLNVEGRVPGAHGGGQRN